MKFCILLLVIPLVCSKAIQQEEEQFKKNNASKPKHEYTKSITGKKTLEMIEKRLKGTIFDGFELSHKNLTAVKNTDQAKQGINDIQSSEKKEISAIEMVTAQTTTDSTGFTNASSNNAASTTPIPFGTRDTNTESNSRKQTNASTNSSRITTDLRTKLLSTIEELTSEAPLTTLVDVSTDNVKNKKTSTAQLSQTNVEESKETESTIQPKLSTNISGNNVHSSTVMTSTTAEVTAATESTTQSITFTDGSDNNAASTTEIPLTTGDKEIATNSKKQTTASPDSSSFTVTTETPFTTQAEVSKENLQNKDLSTTQSIQPNVDVSKETESTTQTTISTDISNNNVDSSTLMTSTTVEVTPATESTTQSITFTDDSHKNTASTTKIPLTTGDKEIETDSKKQTTASPDSSSFTLFSTAEELSTISESTTETPLTTLAEVSTDNVQNKEASTTQFPESAIQTTISPDISDNNADSSTLIISTTAEVTASTTQISTTDINIEPNVPIETTTLTNSGIKTQMPSATQVVSTEDASRTQTATPTDNPNSKELSTTQRPSTTNDVTSTTLGFEFKPNAERSTAEEEERFSLYLKEFIATKFPSYKLSSIVKNLYDSVIAKSHSNSLIFESKQNDIYNVRTESYLTKYASERIFTYPSLYQCSKATRFCSVNASYCEYHEGDPTSNVILTIPYGGDLTPTKIAERKNGCLINESCFLGEICKDLPIHPNCSVDKTKNFYTKDMADILAKLLKRHTGKRPHIIIMNLHHSLIDVERITNAYDKNDESLKSTWYDFHKFVSLAKLALNGKGLLVNIHASANKKRSDGVNSDKDSILLGYSLSKNIMETSNCQKSSIRSLCNRKNMNLTVMLHGAQSLEYILNEQDISTGTQPDEKDKFEDFGGGIVKWYGSYNGGLIDAIQLNIAKRYTETEREELVEKLSNSLIKFLKLHYS